MTTRRLGALLTVQAAQLGQLSLAADQGTLVAAELAETAEVQVDGSLSNNNEELSSVEVDGANATATTTKSSVFPPYLQNCGIWLAPSAIEGAGLGMYAGRDFAKDETLQPGLGDPVIPIVDKFWHNPGAKSFKFLWEEYTWNGWVVGTDVEGQFEADGASPGFGSTANSFLPVVNVAEGVPQRDVSHAHPHNPTAGSYTSFFDRQSTATRDIAAGEEFYVDYGEHWFQNRPYLGPIPLTDDLDRASKLLSSFLHLKQQEESAADVWDDLWQTFVVNTSFADSRVLLGSFHHQDDTELEELQKLQGDVKQLRLNQAMKSPEWLLEHGTCGDLLYGAQSATVGGRGAFASTDIPENVTIAQLPLIHLTNRSRLDMYYFDTEGGLPASRAKPLRKRPPQLLLNYCFGHGDSTLLLCPYGPIVNYVNHNHERPNVKIVWADPARGNFMPHLLDLPLDALEADDTAKLAFELVTTRPIARDEEVFLDYGSEWQDAWDAHVQTWQPGRSNHGDDNNPVSKEEYWEQAPDEEKFASVFDRLRETTSPLPSNLQLQCHEYFRSNERFAGPLPRTIAGIKAAMDLREDYGWFDCDILRKSEHRLVDGDRYVAVAVHPDEEEEGDVPYLLLEGLPAQLAFRFQEKPYTSDMFSEQAFRHDIRIPDEIFPQTWRNRKQQRDEQ